MNIFILALAMGASLVSCKTASNAGVKSAQAHGNKGFAVLGCKEDNTKKWSEYSSVVCGMPLTFCYIGSRDSVSEFITSNNVIVQDDYQLKLPKKGAGKLLEFQLWDSNGFKEKHVTMPPCVGKTRLAVMASMKHAPAENEPADNEPVQYSGVKCKGEDGGSFKAIEDNHCEAPAAGGELCFSGDISGVIANINKGGVTLGDDMELRKAKVDPKNAKAISVSVWDMPNEEESEKSSIKACR